MNLIKNIVRYMKEDESDNNMIEQKFGFFVIKKIDKDTKKMKVELKTKSEGIPLSEAVIILEGWVNRVKKKLQEPYAKNLKFRK